LIKDLQTQSALVYRLLLDAGVAREVARQVLLQGIETRFTLSGPTKSYITYLRTRLKSNTQKEHRLVAEAIRDLAAREFPLISEIEGWKDA
jgi:thymidylate synthase (FAD)